VSSRNKADRTGKSQGAGRDGPAGAKKDRRRGRAEGADAARGDDPETDAEEPGLVRRVWDQVGPIAVAILIALGIRAMVIESYYVPSGSMLPTMFIGDHVFVSKFSYGSHVPFTGATLPALRDPERGEIAVFALGRRNDGGICPLDECPGSHAEGFVKRIVGLPGDTVAYRQGKLWLNGEPVEQSATGETFTDERGVEYRVLEEDLDGCVHHILDQPRNQGLTQAPLVVPPDRYFLLGDNRDNSNDSRGWGTVHRDARKGPVLFNYWAWNNQESWLAMLNPLTWLDLLWNEMYWGRLGMTYDCRD